MGNKLRIILVSPYLPASDTTGCARKIYDFIRLIHQRGHQVYLLSFCSQEDKERVPLIDPYCRKIYLEDLKDYRYFPARCAGFKKAVSELAGEGEVDILQCENSYLRRYLPERIVIPLVLVEHEVLSVSFRQKAGLESNYIKKLILSFRALKKIFEEKKWYSGFDRIIVFTEADKQAVALRVKLVDPQVIPLGINLKEYLPVTEDKKIYDLIFAGNFSHTPNEDAVLYFYRQIMPLIKEKLPGVTLLIAGAHPSLAIKNLAKADKQVTVTGYVRQIKNLYAQSRVFIAPLRYGTGMCFKVLEALACGAAVVATAIGARGIVPKGIINIADDRDNFAQAVIGLLESADLRQEAVSRGREAVQRFYDWDNLLEKYEEVYYGLLKN
jgi:polysaccharide biosynthesis protein PslH